MEKPNFTLSEDLTQQLDAIKIDVSENFLNGIDTSPFSSFNTIGSGASNLAIGAISSGEQILGTAANVQNSLNSIIGAWSNVDLKQELVDKIMEFIMDEVKSYTEEKLDQLVSETTSLATFGVERITYWTSYYMKGELDKVVQNFYNDPNEAAEKDQMNNEKSSMQEKVQNTLAKAQDIKNKITEYTDKINTVVDDVTSVLSAGPQYIVKTVNNVYNMYVPPLKSQLDQMIEKNIEEARKAIEKSAETAGKWTAQQTAKATQKMTEALLKKAAEAKVTAISFAKAALEWALNMVKSLTGA